jgi:rod shape determining protein RodA
MIVTRHFPAPGSHATRQQRSWDIWRHFDFLLVGTVVAISIFGSVMVYSATKTNLEVSGANPASYFHKQLLFIAIGLVAMAVTATIDYHRWAAWSPIFYAVSLLLLIGVFADGQSVNGSEKWFSVGPLQLEPSEFAKLALILALAAFAAKGKGSLSARALIVALFLGAIPFLLIFEQPDLGTALVVGAVLVTMVTMAGAKAWHLLIIGVIAVIGLGGAVEGHVLKHYQIQRFTSFVHTPNQVSSSALANPNDSTTSSEYNVVNSKDAISHGGISGTGIYKGSVTNEGLVPEQWTDFIFSAVGEQVGLLGAVALFAAFLIVIWRTWRSAILAQDVFGRLICVGVLAMIVFQVFENAGMAMGIMPVTGIPLPWVSYGGSAVIVDFIGVGLVLSVWMRRED